METLGYSVGMLWLIGFLVLWESVWKAFALWRAAKNDSVPWFVVIMIFNTAGILPILYLFIFGKKK
ncbi:MAG: DUF5652 family protein [Patescibacteria group bacterium]|nr:DUF5652 family protein [Patescibacteria group bacterium]